MRLFWLGLVLCGFAGCQSDFEDLAGDLITVAPRLPTRDPSHEVNRFKWKHTRTSSAPFCSLTRRDRFAQENPIIYFEGFKFHLNLSRHLVPRTRPTFHLNLEFIKGHVFS